jgi:hypothetical protein
MRMKVGLMKVTIMLLSNSCNCRAILWLKRMKTLKWAAICLTLACALAIPAHASTIIVTNTNDSGVGSLRQALADANDGDTIDATGISGAIALTSGELLVDKSVTINAAGADVLAVDGNATSRVFQIGTGETVTISGLTIRNGHDDTTGGGIDNESGATLTITNSTLSGNTAGSVGNPSVEGGGIFNSGTLTIVNSTVSGNTAGGISGGGGGMFNGGTLTIVNSTVSDNTAIKGAGVHNGGAATSTVTITNSTFSGNAASVYGGACFNGGTLQIANSTLSHNSAGTFGGGILNFGPLQIGNTILNRGDSGENIHSFGGTITSTGYNLSSDDGGGFLTGPGDQINTDPMLGPLQGNGGPTFTHALLPGSPAIDMGDPNFTPPPFFDQRGSGFSRVVNGRIDIGSFEVQTQTVAIHLRALGSKVGGINTVRLTWTGATSNNIDVNRDGVVIATVPNTGTYIDSTGDTGRARYTYEVCEAGTSSCSNKVTVRFRH